MSCTVSPEGALTVTISKPEGNYRPWWTTYRVEVIATRTPTSVSIDGHPGSLDKISTGYAVLVPFKRGPTTITYR